MLTGNEEVGTGQDPNLDEGTIVGTTPTDITPEVVEETEAPKEADDNKNETARETVLKSLKELEAKANESAGSEGQIAPKEERVRGKDGKFVKAPAQAATPPAPTINDPELLPPERLKPDAKEAFKNLPEGMKREYHRMVKEQEATFTTKSQELAREKEATRGMHEAVQPYLNKWGAQGWTAPAAIAQLASAQERLTDPKTKIQTYFELGRDIGVPDNVLQSLQEHLGGATSAVTQTFDISKDPTVMQLQETIQSLQSELGQIRSSPAVQEIKSVQQDVDPATGRLKYPELQDEAYIQSLKPRVSELIESNQASTLSDALVKATLERRQKLFPDYSTQPIQTRLPAAKAQTTRPTQGAVSVRGRSVPLSVQSTNADDIPPEALINPRATVAYLVNKARRG